MNTVGVCLHPLSQFSLPAIFSCYHSAACAPSFTHHLAFPLFVHHKPFTSTLMPPPSSTLPGGVKPPTNGISESNFIQPQQFEHFFLFAHSRPTCVDYLHQAAVAEPHRKSLKAAQLRSHTSGLGQAQLLLLPPPQALADGTSCTCSEDLTEDLFFIYSSETCGITFTKHFPIFHLIIPQVFIYPHWRNPTGIELNQWEKEHQHEARSEKEAYLQHFYFTV